MQKRRLGISLYPERSTFEQDVAYLEKAAKLGFDLLFIALLGAGDRQQTIDRYKPLLAKAKELGFEIEADVNPMMFERMGINASFFHGPLDLSFFTELQVDILRLDLGLNDMEEAFLSKNKEGIKICVNGCNTQDHVGHVLAAGGDRDMILGCHNYYPHRYTGVSLEHFEKGSAPMVKHNLRLQSFVTSQNPEAFGPWPVTEGLPTLEMHRDWPIEIQVGHYVMMGYVNDIIIANAYATDEDGYNRGQHCVYCLTYHMIFVTHYRKPVINDEMSAAMKEFSNHMAEQFRGKVLSAETDRDHIHLLVSLPPNTNISVFVRSIKTQLSREMRKRFPEQIKQYIYGDDTSFWSRRAGC